MQLLVLTTGFLSEIVEFPPRATFTPWPKAHRGTCQASTAKQITNSLSFSLTNTIIWTLHPPSRRDTHITIIARSTCRERFAMRGSTTNVTKIQIGMSRRDLAENVSIVIVESSRGPRKLWSLDSGGVWSQNTSTTRVSLRYRSMSSGRGARRECRS